MTTDITFREDFHTPQLICKVEDEKLGFQGFLVIDTLFGGHCAGGVRVTPALTEGEVIQLARTMTMKFGFLNIYMGGAKAGIAFSNNKSPEERSAALNAFGERLGLLIKRGIYYPGADTGTNSEDIQLIENGAGIRRVLLQEDKDEDSGYFTGVAAVAAAKETAKYAGIDLNKAKVAIEGIGKVGSAIAIEIYREAAVVGVSTIKGAVYNINGINVEHLVKSIKKNGDEAIAHYKDAEKMSPEPLLESDVDILFLCGKPRSITHENVNKIKAKVIIGAGNLCFDDGAEEVLYRRGIYTFPDFMTSCGGVLGLTLRGQGLSLNNTVRVIKDNFAAKINKFIEISWMKHRTPMEAAQEIVQRNLYRMRMRESKKKERRLNRIYSLLMKGEWRSLTSKIVVNTVPEHYHRLPLVQDFLLYHAREQFFYDNELVS